MTFVTSKKAQEHFGVTAQTLRVWAKDGKIESIKTEGGHRRYKIKPETSGNYIYCRVSSRKQESDLARQVEFMRSRYPDHTIKSDVGSGINHKRPSFKWLLEQLYDGNIKEVRVVSMDRWSRFGNDMFKWTFQRFGASLISEKEYVHKSKSEELADDLMEIITVFSAKYYGSRKYSNPENPDIPIKDTEGGIQETL